MKQQHVPAISPSLLALCDALAKRLDCKSWVDNPDE